MPLLFTLLADPSLPIRLATCVALLRIVAKGLKEPGDKLQLIKVLSLGQVIDALEAKTRQQQLERGSETDEGEESYRESLGKLFNVFGLELTKLEVCTVPIYFNRPAFIVINRIAPMDKCVRRRPAISLSLYRCCFDLWRMNMMTRHPLYFLSFRLFLPM